MKRKYLSLGLLALTVGVLVGCSNGSEKTAESTTKNSGEATAASSSKESTASTKSEDSSTQNSTQLSSSSTETTPADQAEQVLSELATLFPGHALPNSILTGTTKNYISAATTSAGDQTNFNILYYAEDQPIKVNSTELNELKPIAAMEKITFASDEEAKSEVGKIEDYSGSEVDLGYGLTGYMQGAAGSSYLTWAEGNWNVTIKASNIDGEDPVKLGKEVVMHLEENMLPVPEQDGNIQLEVGENGDYQTNSVVWQKKNIVYKIHHFNAIQVVKMATSTNG
ncbi:hypothetical protein [Candidatus Enterococcus clewellii]|uniref:Lipoprotein n=1 Tax=Candidatus Enterococcus clewellii TaxID=1834193 RepID=A0A242K5K8_9ENTE|nr:hypothetical protein [Enterococcus sp. 9E7_DIV0242]OTP14725.1 hypothetical protein A5888_002827 [Enterococcus sp. 9E7_DIV0242]